MIKINKDIQVMPFSVPTEVEVIISDSAQFGRGKTFVSLSFLDRETIDEMVKEFHKSLYKAAGIMSIPKR